MTPKSFNFIFWTKTLNLGGVLGIVGEGRIFLAKKFMIDLIFPKAKGQSFSYRLKYDFLGSLE